MAPRRLATAALALWLSGCAAGPDYERPTSPEPAAFENAPADGISTQDPVVVWWREFGDPKLEALVDRAVAGNYGVREASALVRQARALYDEEHYDLSPTLTATGSYTRQLLSNSTFLSGVPRSARTFGYWSGGFDATWELDLFGRVRRSVEAASAEVGVSEASRGDVLLTLLAEVARNYFEWKGARYRLEVARQSARVQEETLKLTTARLEAGRGTELDVARARTEFLSTQAILPPIEVDIVKAKNRLAVLLGVPPQGFELEGGPPGPPDALPPLVAIGKPADLLRRRPDVRRAERELASSTASVGVATADLFPRVTFSGTFGPQAPTVAGLFRAGAAAYQFGPNLTWPALDLGRVAARIRAAGAKAEADLDHYQETVLQALEDAENALVSFGRERTRREVLVQAVAASERAASLADIRYQGGAADFLTTLDAQRTLLDLKLQLAESQTRTVTALVAVYKALGGGWFAAKPE